MKSRIGLLPHVALVSFSISLICFFYLMLGVVSKQEKTREQIKEEVRAELAKELYYISAVPGDLIECKTMIPSPLPPHERAMATVRIGIMVPEWSKR